MLQIPCNLCLEKLWSLRVLTGSSPNGDMVMLLLIELNIEKEKGIWREVVLDVVEIDLV